MKLKSLILLVSLTLSIIFTSSGVEATQTGTTFQNPVIYADVPDPSVIRVGNTFYMTSTTMHMNPGVPVMRSYDLVNWEIVNYVYDTLGNMDAQMLRNGQSEYGKGSWASSLKYHNGTYYAVFSSSTAGRTFIYKTQDIENGTWTRSTINFYHDMSLLFDDDGRVYLAHGGGDIRLTELTSDASAVKPGGVNQIIIPNASAVAGPNIGLAAEGAHLQKINGKYYISLITWPQGGNRTQLIFRADQITGPYEGRVALNHNGIAQGGLIDTANGDWYAFLFRDFGAVGRIPYLVPVRWQNGWPVFGNNGQVPVQMPKPVYVANANEKIISSDEFDGTQLGKVWQWNHNPDPSRWSLNARPGYMRITTGRTNSNLLDTINTLTQRSYGPESSGQTMLDVSRMRNGDYAGLAAFQKNYGYVGVKMSNGQKSIVMVNASSGNATEVASIPLSQNNIYVKIDMDFKNRTDKAYFYYSLDGNQWTAIGNTLQMSYTLPHFMGYRYALFYYSTQSAGGNVDFDYFRIEKQLTGTGGSGPAPIQNNAVYYLENQHSGLRIGISGASTAAGAQAVQSNNWGAADHEWRTDSMNNGYYKLTNVRSGKVLGIENMSTSNGAKAVLKDSSNAADQEWQFVTVGNGYYKLVNRHSGKVLGVTDMSTATSASLLQWDDNGTADHNWKFNFIR